MLLSSFLTSLIMHNTHTHTHTHTPGQSNVSTMESTTSHRLQPDCSHRRFQRKHSFVYGLLIARVGSKTRLQSMSLAAFFQHCTMDQKIPFTLRASGCANQTEATRVIGMKISNSCKGKRSIKKRFFSFFPIIDNAKFSGN